MDRSGHYTRYASGGVLAASLATMALPRIAGHTTLFVVMALFGALTGITFVAVSVDAARRISGHARAHVRAGRLVDAPRRYAGAAEGPAGRSAIAYITTTPDTKVSPATR